MAVAYVQDWPIVDRSTDNYDLIADKIGTGPFDGLILHSAGFDEADGVFRIFDIWESKEQAQQCIEANLQPLIEQGPDAFRIRGVRSAVAGRVLRAPHVIQLAVRRRNPYSSRRIVSSVARRELALLDRAGIRA